MTKPEKDSVEAWIKSGLDLERAGDAPTVVFRPSALRATKPVLEKIHGHVRYFSGAHALEYEKFRFGFMVKHIMEEKEIGLGLCIRKNEARMGADGYFDGDWHKRWQKYQVFRKCLYTKKGICRRCGATR